jgi:hypothetical protein
MKIAGAIIAATGQKLYSFVLEKRLQINMKIVIFIFAVDKIAGKLFHLSIGFGTSQRSS